MHALPNKNVVVIPVYVKYKGLMDLDGLYKMVREWFAKERYEFHEKVYKDKLFSPLGTEFELDWWAERRLDEYAKFRMDLYFHFWDKKEVEIVENGIKKEMAKARLSLMLQGTVLLDYSDMFGKGKFNKFLGELLKKLKKRDIQKYLLEQLEGDLFRLQTEIKNFLSMYGEGESFY